MKRSIIALGLALLCTAAVSAQSMKFSQKKDITTITVTNPTKYLILPVEENMDEKQVKLDTGSPADTWMDVRLAQKKVDYYVPFALGKGETATVRIKGLKKNSFASKYMRLSDTWDVTNTDYYRPIYHHTPSYGWMNDANGLVYKDGEYHLYFQYNPYGSKWGNMHWGHAVSGDLMHWKELAPAIARDTMGHIFSGSSVVDKWNSAGYGRDAIIAFYTSASDKNGQIQCMAYSTDNGRTFTKYEKNPILTPFDGLKDFRDPKVFRYEGKWYMIVSADKEMRFYTSQNLKDWKYVSAFGKGYGAQPNQFECPDFFPLLINGKTKYVMIVNINPGCLFGGSATEYFIGDFDGTTFTCDNEPKVAKFLDWGKDHYATVTFANTGDRVIAVPWISNWQYANVTPIQQYRGANGLPRELFLFESNGETYMGANVVKEVAKLRTEPKSILVKDGTTAQVYKGSDGAFELSADITPADADTVNIDLKNGKGEVVKIYLDMKGKRLVMDRTQSGNVAFGSKSSIHDIEKKADVHEHREMTIPARQANSVNYVNDFALGTWAPLSLCQDKTYHLDIYVDKCSVEIFVDGGRIAMTNLVFPTQPYDEFIFSLPGNATAKNVKTYKIKM